MNKNLLAAMLTCLAGTTFGGASFAQAPAQDPLTTDFQKYVTDVQDLQKQFTNQLTQLNKDKGYDPRVYQLILIADNDLSEIPPDMTNLNTAAKDINEKLSLIKDQIALIQKIKPKVPTTFPGQCVAYKSNPVTGMIELSATRKWVFITAQQPNNPYQISDNVGWTDGNPAILSRTIEGKPETAYLQNGKVVCLEPLK